MDQRISRTLSLSEHLYRVLLLLYPADHQREYGPLMVQLFRDTCRDALELGGAWGLVKLWLRTLPDIATTAIGEYFAKKGTHPMTDTPTKIDKY